MDTDTETAPRPDTHARGPVAVSSRPPPIPPTPAEIAKVAAAETLRLARIEANRVCDQLAGAKAAAARALRALLSAEMSALDLGVKAGVRQSTVDEHRRRKVAVQMSRHPSSNGKSAPEQPTDTSTLQVVRDRSIRG
ncbi:MAG: hypothetical protein ACYCST_04525 [Acidimicrobiales bacterium]